MKAIYIVTKGGIEISRHQRKFIADRVAQQIGGSVHRYTAR